MNHQNRKSTYLMLGVAGLAVAVAVGFGINPAYLLLVAICPLMMFFMMRHMSNMNTHEVVGRSRPGAESKPVRTESHH